jgi:hypothetical protein
MSGASSCAQGVEQLGGAMAQVLFLSGVTDLTDGQRAAALWLLNSLLCRSLQILARLALHPCAERRRLDLEAEGHGAGGG